VLNKANKKNQNIPPTELQSNYLGSESPGFLLAALKAAADLPLADVEVATRQCDGFSGMPAQNPTFLLAEPRLPLTHNWLLLSNYLEH
jgi:hypothetical protein